MASKQLSQAPSVLSDSRFHYWPHYWSCHLSARSCWASAFTPFPCSYLYMLPCSGSKTLVWQGEKWEGTWSYHFRELGGEGARHPCCRSPLLSKDMVLLPLWPADLCLCPKQTQLLTSVDLGPGLYTCSVYILASLCTAPFTVMIWNCSWSVWKKLSPLLFLTSV